MWFLFLCFHHTSLKRSTLTPHHRTALFFIFISNSFHLVRLLLNASTVCITFVLCLERVVFDRMAASFLFFFFYNGKYKNTSLSNIDEWQDLQSSICENVFQLLVVFEESNSETIKRLTFLLKSDTD